LNLGQDEKALHPESALFLRVSFLSAQWYNISITTDGGNDLDTNEYLTYDTKPKLRNPFVICGIDGWLNGGDVATSGIDYLINQFKAIKFAELKTSRFHVYQVSGSYTTRPSFKMKDGVIRETEFPKSEFYFAPNISSDNDLIFFAGTEPNLCWEEYADTVVGVASEFGAKRVYTFGGLFDRSPYTREPNMTCTCTSDEVKQEMEKYNVLFSSREGAASINLMILHACQKKGIDGVNLTVRAPVYPEFNTTIEYSPKSIKAVLVRFAHHMNLKVDFDELDTEIATINEKFDAVRRSNPQFNTYIEDLEKNFNEMPYQEPFDISANEALKFAEELLRNNRDQNQE
jgi:proteasome assembly chaperone (PAC2) family protein